MNMLVSKKKKITVLLNFFLFYLECKIHVISLSLYQRNESNNNKKSPKDVCFADVKGNKKQVLLQLVNVR